VLAFGEDHYQKLLDASLHRSTIHGANVIGQIAAISALEKCDVWLKDFVRHLTRMRDICVSALNEMPGVSCQLPEGCYVAFADIKGTGKSSQEIYELILAEAKVAVVPGLKEWFGEGAEGYIRLSFATSEDILKDALGRMHKVLSRV
jgi:aminotransferase